LINFFSENIPFKLKEIRKLKAWIGETIKAEGYKTGQLNFIFCDDEYLLELNVKYLKHRTLTDILTFPGLDKTGMISGDIFISIPRVEENSGIYKKSFENELRRVIIHGVLHLSGYNDSTDPEILEMRKKEDQYLELFRE